MQIAVLVVDGLFDSGLSSVLDVLSTANTLRDQIENAPLPFEVTIVGNGQEIRTGHGLRLKTTAVTKLRAKPDLLVMPAVGLRPAREVVDCVRDHPCLSFIQELEQADVGLASACSGAFFLAEAGVLDGLAATTSWWLGAAFRNRYPAVKLDGSRTLIQDGRVTTAGAAFAHIDLALSVVQRRSPGLADLVARHLLIGDRPSQAAFAVPNLLARANPTMRVFERWVRDHLSEPLQISQAAQHMGVSERTLQRTTAAVVGMTPMDFVHEIRLDHATFLLRTTNHSPDTVAAAVGYQNASTLRALVRRRRQSNLSTLRKRAY